VAIDFSHPPASSIQNNLFVRLRNFVASCFLPPYFLQESPESAEEFFAEEFSPDVSLQCSAPASVDLRSTAKLFGKARGLATCERAGALTTPQV